MILYDGFKFLSHLEMTVFPFMFTKVRVVSQEKIPVLKRSLWKIQEVGGMPHFS